MSAGGLWTSRAHWRCGQLGALVSAVEGEWPRARGRVDLRVVTREVAAEPTPVLTACRVWRFADEGRDCSKTEAAEWALARDPTLEVVRGALGRRHGDTAAVIDAKEVAELLGLVRRLTSS
jgi:Aminoglycoside adenylyltransferase, C-terminal domain